VRQIQNDFDFNDPRGAVADFVERLVIKRKSDIQMPLLQFCWNFLEAHKQNPGDPHLSAKKDGALFLLGSLRDELLELDPASQLGKKKSKKKGAKETSKTNPISVEQLFALHVRPDLASSAPFLRLRACWMYGRFAERARLGSEGTTGDACRECLKLLSDSELPVRVQAATCIQAFLERDADTVEVDSVVLENLMALIERLLRMIAEIHAEEVAGTLQLLVARFPKQITPFAAQLVEQLATQFCRTAGTNDEDDDGEAIAMGSAQTIVTVLEGCAGTEEPQRTHLFTQLAEPLLPVISRLLCPDGLDYLEEALEMLTFLTLYCASPMPMPLWNLFPQLYQSVCGHSTPSLPLPEVLAGGWAPDFMPNLLPPLQNYVARGPPSILLTSSWAEGNMAYPEMLFGIFKKVVNLQGVGSEKDCACAAQLATAVFEHIPSPSADPWMPQYFNELLGRLPKAETAELRRAILVAFAAMIWYNADILIRCMEERACTQQIFETWLQHVDQAKCLVDRKLFMLAFLRLFDLGCAQRLPPALLSGLPHLVRQLAIQTKEIVVLRAKKAAGELQETGDDDDDDEDIDEDDDDDDEFDEMSGSSAWSFQERDSPVTRLDELGLLHQGLQRAPQEMQVNMQSWIGEGELRQWLAELNKESSRMASLAAGMK